MKDTNEEPFTADKSPIHTGKLVKNILSFGTFGRIVFYVDILKALSIMQHPKKITFKNKQSNISIILVPKISQTCP